MDPARHLFVATIFTTLWAGAYQAYDGPIHGPVNFSARTPRDALGRGIPFAATLLIILVTHECGHYVLLPNPQGTGVAAVVHPGPPYFIGTFGAINPPARADRESARTVRHRCVRSACRLCLAVVKHWSSV